MRIIYADDTQLMKIFRPIASITEAASADVTNCCTQIKEWMNINKLKLNDDKTECMLIGPSARCTQSGLTVVQIGSSSIDVIRSVKNLGVVLDSELSMKQHVSQISRVCSFQLRNISKIRKYLTKESLIILILTLVTSRIDYCNILLAGAPKSVTNKLQHIQNTAARIVSSCRKYDNIIPILHDLH
ncbi:uncharacterized protein LOC124264272 [Haliotis rubra]|uniref:uncharacterized protein LOC124264272 n=1 Tax=Haliotis rubra TaxID=36100 RepID=UPI001EE61F61|nr:uncharacterized protein LOC124264272 [Haliotis rubra]